MALGKSLNNILEDYFGEAEMETDKNTSNNSTLVKSIDISSIKIGPYQTRTNFDQEALEALGKSILENGQIQPILVYPTEDGYVLLAGERRLRASQLVGLTTIEAKIANSNNLNEEKKVFLTAYENLLRENLNPIELAKTFELLIKNNNLTELELGKQLGKSIQYIKNHLRLLNLSNDIQDLLVKKLLTEGQARHLVGKTASEQLQLANQIINQSITVRELESIKKDPVTKSTKVKGENEINRLLEHPMFIEILNGIKKIPNSTIDLKGSFKKGKILISWTPEISQSANSNQNNNISSCI
jgi:ParB family transcriptional regulator, chromosome partitioning protein